MLIDGARARAECMRVRSACACGVREHEWCASAYDGHVHVRGARGVPNEHTCGCARGDARLPARGREYKRMSARASVHVGD
eukprot:5530629-Pleurochrysis_carterae.AAC.4